MEEQSLLENRRGVPWNQNLTDKINNFRKALPLWVFFIMVYHDSFCRFNSL